MTIIIKLLQKMPKNQKKRVTNCDRHNFSLKPRSQYIAQPQYLHVSFCTQPPFITQKQQQPVDTEPCINAPIFNRDNNFATPTFVLTSQQVILETCRTLIAWKEIE